MWCAFKILNYLKHRTCQHYSACTCCAWRKGFCFQNGEVSVTVLLASVTIFLCLSLLQMTSSLQGGRHPGTGCVWPVNSPSINMPSSACLFCTSAPAWETQSPETTWNRLVKGGGCYDWQNHLHTPTQSFIIVITFLYVCQEICAVSVFTLSLKLHLVSRWVCPKQHTS